MININRSKTASVIHELFGGVIVIEYFKSLLLVYATFFSFFLSPHNYMGDSVSPERKSLI